MIPRTQFLKAFLLRAIQSEKKPGFSASTLGKDAKDTLKVRNLILSIQTLSQRNLGLASQVFDQGLSNVFPSQPSIPYIF